MVTFFGVQVFLVLYNVEVDRASLLQDVLARARVRNLADVTLELLSCAVTGQGAQLLRADLVLVLAHTWVRDAASFAFLHEQHLSLQTMSIEEEIALRTAHARPSLFLLRRLHAHDRQAEPQHKTSRPHDFPVEPSAWRDLSSGQQLMLVFLSAVGAYLEAAELAALTSTAAPRLTVAVADYKPHASQQARVLAALQVCVCFGLCICLGLCRVLCEILPWAWLAHRSWAVRNFPGAEVKHQRSIV